MSDYKDITEVQGSMLKEKPWSPLFNAVDAMSVQTYMLKMADNRIVWENNVTKLCAENMNSMWGQLEAMSEAILCINDSFNAFQEDVANLYKYISSLYDKIIIAVTNNFKNMLEVTLKNNTEIQSIITNQIRGTATTAQSVDTALFTDKDNYMYLNDVQIAYYNPPTGSAVNSNFVDKALICFARPEVRNDTTLYSSANVDDNTTIGNTKDYLDFDIRPYKIRVEALCKSADNENDEDVWVLLSNEEYRGYANSIDNLESFPVRDFMIDPYNDTPSIPMQNATGRWYPIMCTIGDAYSNVKNESHKPHLNLANVTTLRIKITDAQGNNWIDSLGTDGIKECYKSYEYKTNGETKKTRYRAYPEKVKFTAIYNKRGTLGVEKYETPRIDFDRFLKQSLSYGTSNPTTDTKGLYYFKIINEKVQGS